MKSIILIVTDTFRYDNLARRAQRVVHTPELDRFSAERATAIERFYTGSFPTIPHRTDLAASIVGWPHYGWQEIDKSGPNHIGRLLGQAGYATQLICDCPHLFNARFQHGFEAAYQTRGQEGDRPLLHLNDPMQPIMPEGKTRQQPMYRGHPLVDVHRWTNRYYASEADGFYAKSASTAMRWLEENSADGAPFFLWVDFFDPHEPWDAPEYMVRRYDPDYNGAPMIHPNYGRSSAYTPEELHNLWAHYAAEAELVDRWIGRLLQKIDDLRLWDDSIVAITSDHGFSIGEHARSGKSNIDKEDERYWPIYPEVGRVPFLVAGGAVPAGQSLDLIAQPVDILPTLCDLAGVAIDPPQPLQGLSFAGSVLTGANKHRPFAVSGSFIASAELPWRCVTPFLVAERWGYAPVGAAGKPELYDLSADPLATVDLAASYGSVVADLHDVFLSHLTAHKASERVLALWQGTAQEA